MNYIAVDFEFNQSIKKLNPRTDGARCPFEIIQIGAVRMNDRMEVTGNFNFLVKPQIHLKLHPYVLKLTGLNHDILDGGCSFSEAYTQFKEFIGGESVLCVWGVYDLTALSNNIIYYNPNISKLIFNYVNVQEMASRYLQQPPGMAIGLKNAVERLGIAEDILYHNALNDAIYTAKIFESVRPEKIEIKKFSCKNKLK